MAFVVPGAPVPKGRPRVMRNKWTGKVRGVTPPRTEHFEALVKLVAYAAKPKGWPMRCEYEVAIHAVRARRGRGDCSNIAKSTEDGLNGVVWTDDERVAVLRVTRDLDKFNPRTEVTITAIPVACSRESCGALTYYPDDDGRCSECPKQRRARKP